MCDGHKGRRANLQAEMSVTLVEFRHGYLTILELKDTNIVIGAVSLTKMVSLFVICAHFSLESVHECHCDKMCHYSNTYPKRFQQVCVTLLFSKSQQHN